MQRAIPAASPCRYRDWDCIRRSQVINLASGMEIQPFVDAERPSEAAQSYCDPTDGHAVIRIRMDHYLFYFSVSCSGHDYEGSQYSFECGEIVSVNAFALNTGSYCGDGTHTC